MEFENIVRELKEELDSVRAKLEQSEEKVAQLEEENDLLALENDLLRRKVETLQSRTPVPEPEPRPQIIEESIEVFQEGGNDYVKQKVQTWQNAAGGKNMISTCFFVSPNTDEMPDLVLCGGVDAVLVGYDCNVGVQVFSQRLSAPILCIQSVGACIACGTMDGTLAVMQFVDLSDTLPLLATYNEHSKYVVSVAFTPQGELLASASYDKFVHIYERNSLGHYEKMRSVQFETTPESLVFYSPSATTDSSSASPDTQLIIGLRDVPYLIYLQPRTGEQKRVSFNVQDWDIHVSFTPLYLSLSPNQQQYLLVCTDKNMHVVYKTGTNKRVRILSGHNAGDYSKPVAVWSATGDYIYCNSEEDSSLYVYSICSQRVCRKLSGHTGIIRGVASHPQRGLAATASYDKSVILWSNQV